MNIGNYYATMNDKKVYFKGDCDTKSLRVCCDNTTGGCEWVGELRSLEKHLSSCSFTPLPCPNECKDDGGKIVMVQRKDLRKHKLKCPRRQYKCPHCKKAGEYQERTTTHLNTCPKVKVVCPNSDCGERVARCSLDAHCRDCPFEQVPCKYACLGCKGKFLRRDKVDHEDDTQQHLQMAIDTVSELKSELIQQKTTVFKLSNFEQRKIFNSSANSPPFYASPGGYKMCINVRANGCDDAKDTHVSVLLGLSLLSYSTSWRTTITFHVM